MQASNWTRFWQSERHAFDEVMRLATRFFARRFCEKFPVQSGVHVFDYGCGPGFLADALEARDILFSGADINAFFIDICKEHHPKGHFFTIHAQATDNIALLEKNLNRPADYIILLSISQYLAAPSDLEQIIASLKQHLNVGGSFVVADVVDENTRSYRDALSLLFHAATQGKLGSFVRFMRYVLSAEYAKVASSNQLQQISESFMHEMSGRLGLHCRQEKGMTFHPTRKNYILQRKNQ
jgi:2-polyprenyl-3-methyl-5-hydroxy-6-metoxy-1,4-benzoquinol methylase